jgi:hypothetical protein
LYHSIAALSSQADDAISRAADNRWATVKPSNQPDAAAERDDLGLADTDTMGRPAIARSVAMTRPEPNEKISELADPRHKTRQGLNPRKKPL